MDHINVTLLLAGGHRTGLRLDSRDPLLATLLSAMQAKSKGAELPVFNLPVEGGAKSLIFSATDLIGVVTDPPLARARKDASRVEKSRYLLIEDFLDKEWHAALLQTVLREEGNFVDSTVSTSDPDYRRSKVLHHADGVRRLFEQRISAAAPEWLKELGMPAFTPASVEVQVTAHGDGNYFKLHNDSGSADAATRGLTFVYYLFNEPKAFSGGEFRLYDSVLADGEMRCGALAETIAPKNNSILVFAPHCHHEVLPVSVPSGRFRDGRFTVNGWLRRAA